MTTNFSPVYSQHTYLTRPIYSYAIFGERHSGTNWLEKVINTRLYLSNKNYFGENSSKHFLRFLDWNRLSNAHDTLFICITRNIYDWIHGFYKLPHHVGANICYDMHHFLTSEWKNEDRDYDYITLQPYKNIFELRKSKLIFYYSYLSILVDNLIIIKYEDLMIDPENIINYISNLYGCNKTQNQYSKMLKPMIKKPYKIKKETRKIINKLTSWDTEKTFGYYLLD